MCDDRLLGGGLCDGDGVVFLGKKFHLDVLVSSMSSHPDLSSSVKGGGAGYFATRLEIEPLADFPRVLEWLFTNQHIMATCTNATLTIEEAEGLEASEAACPS